jgi:hypothetical protein
MVEDDVIRALLKGSRLQEADLFGKSDFGPKTMASLGVRVKELFEAHERGCRELGGDGVFFLIFETLDGAADAAAYSWPPNDQHSPRACFPVQGPACRQLPFVDLATAKRLGCCHVPKARRRCANVIIFFYMGDAEGHHRTRLFTVLPPSDRPLRHERVELSSGERAAVYQRNVNQWIDLKANEVRSSGGQLDALLAYYGVVDLGFNRDEVQRLRAAVRRDIEDAKFDADANRRENLRVDWGLETDASTRAEETMKMLFLMDRHMPSITEIVEDIQAVAPEQLKEFRRQLQEQTLRDMDAADRFARCRLRELERGEGLRRLCLTCGREMPTGGYACACRAPPRQSEVHHPSRQPCAPAQQQQQQPTACVSLNDLASEARRARRAGGKLVPALTKLGGDCERAPPSPPPPPRSRSERFAKKRAAARRTQKLPEELQPPALARANDAVASACRASVETKLCEAPAAETVERTMRRLLVKLKKGTPATAATQRPGKARLSRGVVRQLFEREG